MRRALFAALLLAVAGCSRKTTDDWLAQLKSADVPHRREAIRELGSARNDAARVVPALTEALTDESPYVRHDAATTLPKFGGVARDAIPALKSALRDKDASVRHAAEGALKQISPSDAPKAPKR